MSALAELRAALDKAVHGYSAGEPVYVHFDCAIAALSRLETEGWQPRRGGMSDFPDPLRHATSDLIATIIQHTRSAYADGKRAAPPAPEEHKP